ncbi:MAG: endolytic transglycosylase MltG [Alphaproteobacteria bacterium]|nr:endolytic transglycosylase MltG [Alphaproteobacteria bacterium]
MQRTWVRMLLVMSSVILLLGVGSYLIAQDRYVRPGPLKNSKTIIIEKGGSVAKIASHLLALDVIDNAVIFRLGVEYDGLSAKLRAGEYSIPAGSNMRSVASILASGRTVKRRLTIAEGLLTFQILEAVRVAPGLTGEVQSTVLQEGVFLPETYFYSYGDSRENLLIRMRHKLRSELTRIWQQRPAGSLLKTPNEALVLASIIEKETGRQAERTHISGVFHNRLRRRMPLQSDPTVAYSVTLGRSVLKRPLTKSDLRTTSPFNTYLSRGLPPKPIANPGIAAIRAAVLPMKTSNLYFVADGTGGHAFAQTLREHNRNVAKWRKSNKKKP